MVGAKHWNLEGCGSGGKPKIHAGHCSGTILTATDAVGQLLIALLTLNAGPSRA